MGRRRDDEAGVIAGGCRRRPADCLRGGASIAHQHPLAGSHPNHANSLFARNCNTHTGISSCCCPRTDAGAETGHDAPSHSFWYSHQPPGAAAANCHSRTAACGYARVATSQRAWDRFASHSREHPYTAAARHHPAAACGYARAAATSQRARDRSTSNSRGHPYTATDSCIARGNGRRQSFAGTPMDR